MFVNIIFYSISKSSLKKNFALLNTLCLNKKFKLKFFISNYHKKSIDKRFTVLKSPHVNKTAQEQFKQVILKKKD